MAIAANSAYVRHLLGCATSWVPLLRGFIIGGFIFGPNATAGILAGNIISGVQVAISQSNSGGAWDNAKKYIETGKYGGKNSEAHKASVTGDTVGDPCKDTAGPSIHILIKLLSTISLVLVPLFSGTGH